MGAALIVSLLALSVLTGIRIQLRQVAENSDTLKARLYARAGIDMALYQIKHDANWRQNAANWTTDHAVGTGYFSFTMTDPVDGNLTNSIYDPVVIVATGKSGTARHKLRVRLDVELPGVECMKSCLHANKDVTFKGVTVTTDHWITANGKVSAQSDGGNNTVVNADVACAGGATKDGASVYNGQTTTDGKWPMAVPDSLTALDYYKTNGTWINVASLPRWDAELVDNAGMELVPSPGTGWVAYGGTCTLARSTTKTKGTYSLAVTARSSAACGPGQDVTSKIASGLTYATSLYAYTTAVTTDSARITLKTISTGSGVQTIFDAVAVAPEGISG